MKNKIDVINVARLKQHTAAYLVVYHVQVRPSFYERIS